MGRGYFAYGGNGAKDSCLIYFAIPPGKRLGRHTVEQHWTDEVWPGDLTVTKSPNE